MTEKQKRFCDEYLIDCNATRAYKAVYKNIKNDGVARRNGSRLLTNADIKKYIDARMEELHNEKTADAQEVIEYLSAVLRGESTAQEIVVVGTGDGCSKAKTVEKAPSEKERLKAAELLGKRYALFTDRVDMDTDMDLNITIDYGDNDNEES
ncbi:terminase small subunit [Anaerostipes sp. 494a]|uniref:terminase small subunit n=1 Tax=Anaerostipes TaxID=207244 RepID=UPI0009528401|nr:MULTISPECIES: terminase small subunit [Anaerostipes]OLR58275.1 terminase small subunit [Anaerostipes sp. 494a]